MTDERQTTMMLKFAYIFHTLVPQILRKYLLYISSIWQFLQRQKSIAIQLQIILHFVDSFASLEMFIPILHKQVRLIARKSAGIKKECTFKCAKNGKTVKKNPLNLKLTLLSFFSIHAEKNLQKTVVHLKQNLPNCTFLRN